MVDKKIKEMEYRIHLLQSRENSSPNLVKKLERKIRNLKNNL